MQNFHSRNKGQSGKLSKKSYTTAPNEQVHLSVNRNNIMSAMRSKLSMPTAASDRFTNPYLSRDVKMPMARGLSSKKSPQRPGTQIAPRTRIQSVQRIQKLSPSLTKIDVNGNFN